ncbi:ion transporter [Elusimicrobiota bacterium]
MDTRKRLYEILEVAADDDNASRVFDLFILTLISLNVVALVLETVQPIYDGFEEYFMVFETVSVLIFTAEYILRIWSCTASKKYSAALTGRARFALTPLAIIDLLAVLPFYMPMLGLDLRVMRAFRLFRIFRIAKLARYSKSLRTFGEVFAAKKAELLTTLSILLLLLIVASSLMYHAEHAAQPANFPSIPAAMWWSIVTLTTVGYGDIYPLTVAGKLLAAVIAVLGIGLFALPTGILGAAFVERLEKQKKTLECPKCGTEISTRD